MKTLPLIAAVARLLVLPPMPMCARRAEAVQGQIMNQLAVRRLPLALRAQRHPAITATRLPVPPG